eukprot:COSAG02_NODE_22383_length_754_cov_1.326718_1_plen_27_part_10
MQAQGCNKLHYMGKVGSVDVPLGLGRQ